MYEISGRVRGVWVNPTQNTKTPTLVRTFSSRVSGHAGFCHPYLGY